jgi:hypothetical protein
MNPIRLVLQSLNLSEWTTRKLGIGKLNGHAPSWIVEGVNLDAVRVLPIAVALRLIPLVSSTG